MSTVLILAAAAVLCTITAVLLAATGRDLVLTEHPLPQPASTARRAPRRADR
ncbi:MULTISPECIES: hypothetical protein [unclassified Nocardiopsis]|uniref:hypothetical protein n=1 Tax=unclassified Nocardiopsis TaxID=2649073 RepID=UPI00191636A4|nr:MULTISPECIES: hypothetical protein [unclassified Nocardiopsis]